MFLSVDGEENGQRGSSEFARRHKAGLLGLRTFVFNMDTLARLKDLAFLETDTNGLRKLSAPLTAEMPARPEQIHVDPLPERETGEQRELVGGVEALDIRRRVRLGIAARLRLSQDVRIVSCASAAIVERMWFVVPLMIPRSAVTRLAPRSQTSGRGPARRRDRGLEAQRHAGLAGGCLKARGPGARAAPCSP